MFLHATKKNNREETTEIMNLEDQVGLKTMTMTVVLGVKVDTMIGTEIIISFDVTAGLEC